MTTSRADDTVRLRFTPRGEAAIADLAAVLTADCDATTESIAQVFDDVMHTPLDELTDALNRVVTGASR